MIKGSWSPDPDNPKKKAKRVINPEGALIRSKELREFAPLIEQAIKAAIDLEKQVERQLQALRKKDDER